MTDGAILSFIKFIPKKKKTHIITIQEKQVCSLLTYTTQGKKLDHKFKNKNK